MPDLTFINDSEAILITNIGELVCYNVFSGKETGYFYPDTSYNALLANFLNTNNAGRGKIIPLKEYLEDNTTTSHIPTASIHTLFYDGKYIYAPFYLLTPYYRSMPYRGENRMSLILDRHLLLLVLNTEMSHVRTVFSNDTTHSCFNFGFIVSEENILASNLMAVGSSRLPVFSKYSVSNNELKFTGESAIEFSKNAYKGRMATFVPTSFARHPTTGNLLFCDTRRIAEAGSEKVFADPVFADSNTSDFIMQFDFISKDENKLQLLIDRVDSSWTHHYSIARYSVPEKKLDPVYQLGTADSIKAYAFHKSALYTLELEGENYIFKKYEMVK